MAVVGGTTVQGQGSGEGPLIAQVQRGGSACGHILSMTCFNNRRKDSCGLFSLSINGIKITGYHYVDKRIMVNSSFHSMGYSLVFIHFYVQIALI